MKRQGSSRPWSGTREAAAIMVAMSASLGAGSFNSGIGAEFRVSRKSMMGDAMDASLLEFKLKHAIATSGGLGIGAGAPDGRVL
ncbi:exported hypothetical protein [Mesorhizobium metallidurans STM 2683]|uniref:Uncharacterized protein n=1 Tax=Mesorhizobium metallidurans STM 2683 TaxID=1297569 RepID=M5ETH0_9HYPH|nr:exported hypothetical protein [Mesorhizobium metallidurans STM 2683]